MATTPEGEKRVEALRQAAWPACASKLTWSRRVSARRGEASDLPRIAIPVFKLESGAQVPAFELAGAKRRTARTLAARSFLEPADDSRARSVAGPYCNAGASARSGL